VEVHTLRRRGRFISVMGENMLLIDPLPVDTAFTHGRVFLSLLVLGLTGSVPAHRGYWLKAVLPWIWWFCRTTWSSTHAWCETCTAGASHTFRFECETAPAWSARW
jgi:hypothetical protein